MVGSTGRISWVCIIVFLLSNAFTAIGRGTSGSWTALSIELHVADSRQRITEEGQETVQLAADQQIR